MNKYILGRNVYRARKDRKFTGEQLSDLCNINPSYLRAIEAGTKTPSLALFTELCSKLNVSADFLLAGVVEYENPTEADRINELCRRATPSQLRMAAAVLETMLGSEEK